MLCAGVSFAVEPEVTPGPPPTPPPSEAVAPQEPLPPPELRPTRAAGRYRYQGEVPEGYHVVSRPRAGLVIAGSVLFGVSYLTTLALGLAWLGDAWAFMPIAGPIITSVNQWARWDKASGSNTYAGAFLDASLLSFYTVIAVFQTALQAAGVTLFTIGLAKPNRWIEKDRVQFTFVPGAPASLGGASLLGLF